jgi:hypothetical protein
LRFNKSPFLAILCLATAARAEEINLIPVRSVREQDGIKFPQLEFTDGKKKITYEQPRGWIISGDSSQIKFTPPDVSAKAAIEQSPLSAPQIFDEATTKMLQQEVLASVPSGSQKTTMLSEEKNPLMMGGHETYEVTVSYQFFGHELITSTLFMNTKDTQLRFRLTAEKADFENVHKAFRGSLFSWQWL